MSGLSNTTLPSLSLVMTFWPIHSTQVSLMILNFFEKIRLAFKVVGSSQKLWSLIRPDHVNHSGPKLWAGALTDLQVSYFFSLQLSPPTPIPTLNAFPQRVADARLIRSHSNSRHSRGHQTRSPSSHSKPAGDLHLMHFNCCTQRSWAVCVLGCEMHPRPLPSARPDWSKWSLQMHLWV